jgi:hypothetical protein
MGVRFELTRCHEGLVDHGLIIPAGEPRAMLGCASAMDFLGDPWTFLKPDQHDLRSLYGTQAQEQTL